MRPVVLTPGEGTLTKKDIGKAKLFINLHET